MRYSKVPRPRERLSSSPKLDSLLRYVQAALAGTKSSRSAASSGANHSPWVVANKERTRSLSSLYRFIFIFRGHFSRYPNVFKHRRPDWLGPFNFLLFPILSETFGGYPKGFDKSNFVFITPYESDRAKWSQLKGVNLVDGQTYQISMQPVLNQDKVIPESFRIQLRNYLTKLEAKSLAPDGTPCVGTTKGILRRATINAEKIVPVGKETDRRWEQGEDPSMIDSDIYIFEKRTKMVVVGASERKRLRALGIRPLKRESRLSQAPISNAIHGIPIKLRTLAIIRQAAARLSTK